jgi:hypothetical protein
MVNRLCEFDNILLDLCRVSLLTPDEGPTGPACASLIRDLIAQGRERFLERHTQTPGVNECRLNASGLKLCYEVDFYREGEETHAYVVNLRIAGEQIHDYPAFVRAAQPILDAANAQTNHCEPVRAAA